MAAVERYALQITSKHLNTANRKYAPSRYSACLFSWLLTWCKYKTLAVWLRVCKEKSDAAKILGKIINYLNMIIGAIRCMKTGGYTCVAVNTGLKLGGGR